MKTKKIKSGLLILFTVLSFSGCGLWLDFTTYFNTYYNAKTLFDRTEEDILKQQKDVFAFRELSTTPQQAKDLTKVIEKCSKILQYKQESSFFNDAIFITGKALYYQGEFAGAQRKFIELAGIPETKYELENKLWLAKTNLQLRNFDQGLALIEDVKKSSYETGREKLFNNAYITHISFLIFREEYNTAITVTNDFLNKVDDDEIAALAYYQLGRLYVLTNDKESALKAFADVNKYSPTYEIQFESMFEYARLLKELGRYDESEREFNKLRYDGKFKDQLDRVLVEIGYLYYYNHEDEKAINIFKDVDSTYRQKPSAGLASMMLGEIYERAFGNYDSSYKYYTKTVTSQAPSDTRVEAAARARDIDKYFNLKTTITNLGLDLKYINDPTEFLRDSIDYEIAYRQYLAEKSKTEQQQTSTFQQRIQQQRQLNQPQVEQPAQEQPITNIGFSEGRDSVSLVALIAQGKVRKPVRPLISEDSIKVMIAQNLYNLGNVFFSELDVPDSAKFYFEKVIANYSSKPAAINSMFALGTFYETHDQKSKADSLFRIIYDNHKKHELFSEAGRKLGLIKTETTVKLATKDPAEQLYIGAETLYFNRDFQEAISQFRNIYLNYPTSSFTPKSIYYIGLIYEEKKLYNSAAFFYGILNTKEYSNTPYGKAVAAKYLEYRNEQDRLEKEARELEEKNAVNEQIINQKQIENNNKNDKSEKPADIDNPTLQKLSDKELPINDILVPIDTTGNDTKDSTRKIPAKLE